jgi:hypothetical protein
VGYTELIHQRLQTMAPDKQAEVYDFVEFVANRSVAVGVVDENRRKADVLAALNAARAAWPKMSAVLREEETRTGEPAVLHSSVQVHQALYDDGAPPAPAKSLAELKDGTRQYMRKRHARL